MCNLNSLFNCVNIPGFNSFCKRNQEWNTDNVQSNLQTKNFCCIDGLFETIDKHVQDRCVKGKIDKKQLNEEMDRMSEKQKCTTMIAKVARTPCNSKFSCINKFCRFFNNYPNITDTWLVVDLQQKRIFGISEVHKHCGEGGRKGYLYLGPSDKNCHNLKKQDFKYLCSQDRNCSTIFKKLKEIDFKYHETEKNSASTVIHCIKHAQQK